MKIVLNSGKTYSAKSVNKNIISNVKDSMYANKAPNENAVSANVASILLDASQVDLFDIEKDFSVENISELVYITESGTEIIDSYDVVFRILQNITDYVNETTVTLVKYNY